jgi:hypothetical protein
MENVLASWQKYSDSHGKNILTVMANVLASSLGFPTDSRPPLEGLALSQDAMSLWREQRARREIS